MLRPTSCAVARLVREGDRAPPLCQGRCVSSARGLFGKGDAPPSRQS